MGAFSCNLMHLNGCVGYHSTTSEVIGQLVKFLDFMLAKYAHARSILHPRVIGRGTSAIFGCLLSFEILLSMFVVDGVHFSGCTFYVHLVLSSCSDGVMGNVVPCVVMFVVCRAVLLVAYPSWQLPRPSLYLGGGSPLFLNN